MHTQVTRYHVCREMSAKQNPPASGEFFLFVLEEDKIVMTKLEQGDKNALRLDKLFSNYLAGFLSKDRWMRNSCF